MSYRNDVEALQVKLAQLEHERAEIVRDRARLVDSVQRMPRVSDDIDRLRRELHARAPRKLPMLDDIRVASPCNARWDDMTGDAQARFCGSCQKNVYNLSEMTREAAQALVRAKEGDLCVRYYRRADGTVLTADCSVGVRRKRVHLVAAAGAVTALAAGAVAAAFAHMGAPVQTIVPTVSLVQGGASAPPEVAPTTTRAELPVSETMGQPIQGGISSRPVPATPRLHPRMGRPIMWHQR
jgi:hypothetical protein